MPFFDLWRTSHERRERKGANQPPPQQTKPSPCKSTCKGFFYIILNDADITILKKPDGMDNKDAIEAIKSSLLRRFEPDDGGKCPSSCICQPLAVETSGDTAPKFTTKWREEITAHIKFVKSETNSKHRTVRAIVMLAKYQGEGICREDKEEADAKDGTFYKKDKDDED